MGSTASWALGRCGLGEDDGATGPGTARIDRITDSVTEPGAQRHELREDNIVAGSGMAS
jgi:hypothetical protein